MWNKFSSYNWAFDAFDLEYESIVQAWSAETKSLKPALAF